MHFKFRFEVTLLLFISNENNNLFRNYKYETFLAIGMVIMLKH